MGQHISIWTAVFGIMFAGFAIAGLLGPTLMKTLLANGLTLTHCYTTAAAISAAGFAAMAVYRRTARG